MKRIRFLALMGLMIVVSVPGRAQSISAAEAKNHIGKTATVCGLVTGERTATSSRGEPTFIVTTQPQIPLF